LSPRPRAGGLPSRGAFIDVFPDPLRALDELFDAAERLLVLTDDCEPTPAELASSPAPVQRRVTKEAQKKSE
jgi:hypothetical protein